MSIPEKVYRVAWLNKDNLNFVDWYVEYGANVESLKYLIKERCSSYAHPPKDKDFVVTAYSKVQ